MWAAGDPQQHSGAQSRQHSPVKVLPALAEQVDDDRHRVGGEVAGAVAGARAGFALDRVELRAREPAALVRADKASLPNGGALSYDAAITLELQPLATAGLPKAPERAPKSPTAFAGHFTLAAPAKAGNYRVTISSEGWVDVLDGGAYLHPIAFTGAKDCEGARKSVKFDLPARPLALQFSGVPQNQISVIVSSDQ